METNLTALVSLEVLMKEEYLGRTSYVLCFQGVHCERILEFSGQEKESKSVSFALAPYGSCPDLCFWWYTTEKEDDHPSLVLEARGAIALEHLFAPIGKTNVFVISLDEDLRVSAKTPRAIAELHLQITEQKCDHALVAGSLARQGRDVNDLYNDSLMQATLTKYHYHLDKMAQSQMTDLMPEGRLSAGAWRHGSTLFPTPNGVAEMPMWFMPLASVRSPGTDWDLSDVRNACLFACQRLQFDETQPFTHDQLVEIGCCAANLFSLSFQYRTDHMRQQAQDQWTWIAHVPRVEQTGADCEDLSEYTLRVMAAMQSLADLAHVNDHESLESRVLQALSHYEFCLMICTLCVKENKNQRYEYHCVVAGIDWGWLHAKAVGDGKVSPSISPRPPVLIEATDFTTSTQKPFPVDLDYDTLAALPSVFQTVLVRDTAEACAVDKEYGHVISLLCPQYHFYGKGPKTVQLDFVNADKQLGVRIETFMKFQTADFDVVKIEASNYIMHLADDYLKMLPPFHPLPKMGNALCNPEGKKAHEAHIVAWSRGFQDENKDHDAELKAITEQIQEYAGDKYHLYCYDVPLYERCLVRQFLLLPE